MPISTLFSNLQSFSNFSDGLESYLKRNVKKEDFLKNDIIYEQDSFPRKIYFVAKGFVTGSTFHEDRQHLCWFKKEGDFFWDSHSLQDFSQAAKQTAVATEDSLLLSISYQALLQMFEVFPESNYIWRKLLEQKIVDDYKRTELLFVLHTTTRYQKFMETYPDDYQRLRGGQIASYLQMDAATLSRIKSKVDF